MASLRPSALDVLLLYNEPTLAPDDPDWASEAGVLESVAAIEAALLARDHRPHKLAVGATIDELLPKLAELPAVDVVFNLFEGFGGVGRGEAAVAGLIELLGYPLTGSPPACLDLVRHKARTKWLLAGAGVPTADFCLVAAEDELDQPALERLLAAGPVIVKPAHEDASLGITSESIASDRAALERQIDRLRERYGAVLVEQFVVGREFNVAVLDLSEPRLLPLAEIEFSGPGRPGWRIVTYEAKWDAGSAADLATPPRCPAVVDAALAERIGQAALAAFRLTGCRDYARVDIRVDEHQRPHVLEVNGNPDLGPTAGYARALAVAGWSYEEFVDRLVRHAAATRGDRRPAVI